MGIYLKKNIEKDTILGLWKIEETIDWCISRLQLNENDLKILNWYNSKHRRLQRLITQLLLQNMLNHKTKVEIKYDKNGKPSLPDFPYEISISHSKIFVAILISKTYNIGIDIEQINPKVERISEKFINSYELKQFSAGLNKENIEQMHVIWGAKESLYKLYGKRNLNFKENLLTEPFDYKQKGVIKARISTGNKNRQFSLYYEKIKDYMLVYVMGGE
ncbi:MAG: 4'-phosphopantetheinyl transferase superfamily protein [Bacteroidota bacterium]